MNIKTSVSRILAPIVVAGIAFVGASTAQATSIGFDYSSTIGSDIDFPGNGTFSFAPATDNLQITLTHNGTGTANGLFGEITGTYTIGAISGNTASVSGGGTFVIHDGLGFNLSGNLTWVNIVQTGTGDGLNLQGTLNLTGVTYGGLNADLLTFATLGQGHGANTLTAQFLPGLSLNDLVGGHDDSTSFSGSVAAVPDGGTTVALLGLGLVGIEVLRRKLQSAVA
jgi:hypothetical protein